jgi:hypothetical protein
MQHIHKTSIWCFNGYCYNYNIKLKSLFNLKSISFVHSISYPFVLPENWGAKKDMVVRNHTIIPYLVLVPRLKDSKSNAQQSMCHKVGIHQLTKKRKLSSTGLFFLDIAYNCTRGNSRFCKLSGVLSFNTKLFTTEN